MSDAGHDDANTVAAMPAVDRGDRWRTGILIAPTGAGDADRRRPAAAVSGVLKLGGSLLQRPDWPASVGRLLQTIGGAPVIVVGGGAVVDGLRAIDAATSCRSAAWDAAMHRLAIDAMGITARVVAEATGLPLVDKVPVDDDSGGAVVLDATAWLHHGGRLAVVPVGWHATSDSIAAIVAAAADRSLLLAKSIPPPPCPDRDPPAVLACVAAAGWVDEFFPAAAAGLRLISWAAPAAG